MQADPGGADRPARRRRRRRCSRPPSVDRHGRARCRCSQAVADLADGARCAESLGRLQARRVPVRDAPVSRREYTFKHALTHEVAYGSLLQERRRALHARTGRGDRDASTPSGSASTSSAWPTTRSGARRGQGRRLSPPGCGQGHRPVSLPRGSAVTFEQALKALRPPAREPRKREKQAIDVRLDLRVALLPFGREAVDPATSAKPRPWPTRSTIRGASAGSGCISVRTSCLIGDTPGALRLGERALELAERRDDVSAHDRRQLLPGRGLRGCGELAAGGGPRSRRSCAPSGTIPVARASASSGHRPSSHGRLSPGPGRARPVRRSRRQGREAVRLAERQNNAWNLIVARSGVSATYARFRGIPPTPSLISSAPSRSPDEQGLAFVRLPVRATLGVLRMRGPAASRRVCCLLEDVWTAYPSAGWGHLLVPRRRPARRGAPVWAAVSTRREWSPRRALERCRQSVQRGSRPMRCTSSARSPPTPTARRRGRR